MPNERLVYLNTFETKLMRLYTQYAHKAGMPATAFWVLFFLCENPQGITQKEIADEMLIPVQTINSSVKKLEEQGLVELHPNPDNRKHKLLFPTTKGQSLIEKKILPVCQSEEKAFDCLSDQEQKILVEYMNRYMQAFKGRIDVLIQNMSEES